MSQELCSSSRQGHEVRLDTRGRENDHGSFPVGEVGIAGKIVARRGAFAGADSIHIRRALHATGVEQVFDDVVPRFVALS